MLTRVEALKAEIERLNRIPKFTAPEKQAILDLINSRMNELAIENGSDYEYILLRNAYEIMNQQTVVTTNE